MRLRAASLDLFSGGRRLSAAPNRSGLRRAALKLLWPILPAWPDEARVIAQRPLLSAMIRRAAMQTSVRVALNAGAGEGAYSHLILDTAAPRHLAEVDRSYVRASLERLDPRQHRARASLTHLPFRAGVFDLVVCTEVLEHIPDDARAAGEIVRVIAPGGWVIVSVPTPPAPFDPAHVREGYTAAELARLFELRGLNVIETGYCMCGALKLILRLFRMGIRLPRAVIVALAYADRIFGIGRPMDLAMLMRKPRSD